MELYIISALALLSTGTAIFSFIKLSKAKSDFEIMKNQFAMCSNKETELRGHAREMENEKVKWHERAISAETSFAALKEQFAKTEGEKIDAVSAKEEAEKKYYEARNEIDLAHQRVADIEKRMQQWEQDKERILRDTQVAMFQTGKEVFTKEAEEINKKALKESEEISKKTKEHFDSIIEKVSVLSSNVDSTSRDIKVVIKSMSSPAAVGQFSEVGLANTLKEYGLTQGQDFEIQYNTGAGEGAKRPDAVLFIRDNIFIIDSKSSKFFLELAEAEGTSREPEVFENIKKSMNKHLADLSSKGYREAVIDEIKKTRAVNDIGHVQTVMFLCNEAHVDKLAFADPDFINKATAKDIIISGPTGLNGLLAFARYSIKEKNIEENQKRIMHEIGILLGSISTVVSHAAKVGNGIKSAAKHYENLVSSVNSNLLSKAGKISKLGVAVPSNKQLPQKLESFEIITHSQHLIDAEAVADEDEADNSNSDVRVLELAAG